MRENAASAHGLDFSVGLVGGGAAIGVDARLAEVEFGGEVGAAQRLPDMGQKCRVAIPAEFALRECRLPGHSEWRRR